jgi:hypothetical protein
MKGRAVTTAVCVALVAALATACGAGATHEAKPAVVISTAYDKTTAGTSRMKGSVTLESEGERLEVQRFTGEQDFDAKTSSAVMRSPLSELDATRDDIVIDAVSVAGTTYERISGLDLPAGKHWVRIRPSDLDVTSADGQAIGSGDPADGLQFLTGVRNARSVGSESVRGTPTTKYTVTIDMERLMDLIAKGSEELSPGLAKGFDALREQVDLSRLPGAVWLDRSGRVRRFRYSVAIRSARRSVRTIATLEFFDFGAPVPVAAPPGDDTVPYAEVSDRMRDFFADLQSDTPSSPSV